MSLTKQYPVQRDKQALLHELTNAGAEIHHDGREIKCPWHEDNTPSSSVFESDDGCWKFKCQARSCGVLYDVFDVYAYNHGTDLKTAVKELAGESIGAPGNKIFHAQPRSAVAHEPEESPVEWSDSGDKKQKTIYQTLEKLQASVEWSVREKSGRVVSVFKYTNPDSGNLDLIVFRIEFSDKKKTFRQAHAVKDGFVLTGPGYPWPLYNRTRLRESEYFIYVEGEKAVHALTKHGFVAITNPGGAGKAGITDWSPCAGKRGFIWGDNDPPDSKTGRRSGIDHARDVAHELEKLEPPCSIYWIDPDLLDLPPKGDAVEYIEKFSGASEDEIKLGIQAVIDNAEPIGAGAEVIAQIKADIAGTRRPIPMPWPMLSASTKAFLPGTVTILCGPPSATKSIMTLEIAAYMFEDMVKLAIMELEEDRTYHNRRVMAMNAHNSNLTDADWCHANPQLALDLANRHKDFVDKFGRCVHHFPDDEITPDALLEWVKSQCLRGCRVIIIDPITAMQTGDKSWIEDHRFLIKAKQIMRNFQASLLLVTHPKKGSAEKSSLDDLAGGASFQRFAQTILWIEMKNDESAQFKVPMGRMTYRYNRLVKICKARNGRGTRSSVGFLFDGSTFRSKELGILVPDSEVELPKARKGGSNAVSE